MKSQDIKEAEEKALQIILLLKNLTKAITELLLEIGTVIAVIKMILESL